MISWYFLAVTSLLCFGIQSFGYKVIAERDYSTFWATFTFMSSVAVISTIMFFLKNQALINWRFLILIAVINGFSYFLSTVTNIEALKKIPANVFYPVFRLNIAITVLFSIFYFNESLTTSNILGIVISIMVAVLIGRTRENEENEKILHIGLLLTLIAAIASSLASISSKFAANNVNQFSFIAVSYTVNALLSLGAKSKFKTQNRSKLLPALILGIIIGILNFMGFYAYIQALKTGPLSIVATIMSLNFIIVIILSILVYKEKLTLKRVLGIVLTIVAMLLLRGK